MRLTGLWRHGDFMRLWIAQTVSQFGSQITQLGLPLTAALVLGASPAQMGILGAAEFAPFLLFGLFAGVWVDRLPRRPILVCSDLGRALLLATIPAAAYLGRLRMEQLYAVGFLAGILTVFFDVAYQSYLPSLVEREQMVEGNSKLEIGRSAAQIAGPGLAGGLIQLVTAPVAILLDSLSFLFSAAFLFGIRRAEPRPERPAGAGNIWQEIGEGLGVVLKSPLLRPIAFSTATSNLFGNVAFAVLILFVTRQLGIDAGALGIVFTLGSVGGMAGATVADRVARAVGVGPTIVGAIWFSGLGTLLVPLVARPGRLGLAVLALSVFVGALGSVVYNITQVSLRQAITPHRLQGRMNASMRFVVWGTIPIGSLIGGFLGEQIGLRETMLVGGLGGLLAGVWVFFSPVRSLRQQPEPVAEPAAAPLSS
ncbi:MAG TPA: MFS transporter [Chloroflexota bacterium]|nr:MFS transporter [Chloroflexota bacterium]